MSWVTIERYRFPQSAHPLPAVMEIQIATAADCRGIAEAHVESWQHAYRDIMPAQYLASLSVDEREAMWRRSVERQSCHLMVARTGGQVAGFIAVGASRDEGAPADRAEIWAFYARPSAWSTGAGRLLW